MHIFNFRETLSSIAFVEKEAFVANICYNVGLHTCFLQRTFDSFYSDESVNGASF